MLFHIKLSGGLYGHFRLHAGFCCGQGLRVVGPIVIRMDWMSNIRCQSEGTDEWNAAHERPDEVADDCATV